MPAKPLYPGIQNMHVKSTRTFLMEILARRTNWVGKADRCTAEHEHSYFDGKTDDAQVG